MNFIKKSILAIALTAVLAVLLTSCVTNAVPLQDNISENNDRTDDDNIAVTLYPSETMGKNENAESFGVAEDDAVISRYYGRISAANGLVVYDISTKQLGEYQYAMDLRFYDDDSIKQIQQLSYTLREDFMPETIQFPIHIDDINKDGNDDFILDLGIYGKIKLALCYVFDSDQKGYVNLIGFDELMTPRYEKGYIYEHRTNDPTEYVKNKYQVNGNELILVASLYANYGGSKSPVYSEKVLIDGEMVIIKEDVPAKEIDVEEWGYSLP